MSPLVSIIIPALNEEEHIGDVLSTIKELMPDISYELILVDNGSSDGTRHIAQGLGANVVDSKHGTVSAVRNYGVYCCHGSVLAFLDADVQITPTWRKTLTDVIERLHEDPMQVLGARCHAPDNDQLLNRFWFNRLREYSASYINSGNLVTSRALFETIEGFDETLTTAEDYDFCQRARNAGATINDTPALKTVHLGYPQSIGSFVKRERWHGRQDFETGASLRESKVAWIACTNLLAFCLCTVLALLSLNPAWLLLYMAILIGISAGLTFWRFGFVSALSFIATSFIYAVYIWGRSLAAIDRVTRNRVR